MKNRKMLLQVLLSMALVLSLIVSASAAGASAAVQVSGSVIFDDQFSDPTLNAHWVISPGKGSYSLTDNPGYLRYIIDAHGWPSGGDAVPLQLIRPFSGDQWVLRTAITYNMRPAEPTNNRNMHCFIRVPGATGATMIFIYRSVGVNDGNPNSNVMFLYVGDNSTTIHFPNSPNPLPIERWYFEIVRNEDYVALRASNDSDDSTFEYEVEYTFPSGVLGNDQEIVIQATGWYGSNDPPGYADFDFISSISTSELGVIEYFLTTSSSAGGSVTTPGEGTFIYDKGTAVDLVAEAEVGYRFVEWSGDAGTIADIDAAETTITMNDHYSITANFIAQYDLAINRTDGGEVINPGEGTFTYDAGTVVDLVAESEEGYQFVRWTGDVSTVGNLNAASTNITMQDDYLITANFAIPPIQYNLTIASTAEGSVTTPGEGIFSYDEGTVVDLVAKPEKGYRFLGWTGDVDTIANVDAASTTISTDGDYSITANFGSVRTGDWIKFEYTTTGWPAGQPCPEWLELEFLSVEGTSASVKVTLRISDGQELSDTVPVDLGEGGGEAFGLAGFVIPPNLTTGDSVYMTAYGDVAIEGETTRTYAGARRRVVYASFSQSVPFQGEVQLTSYWDKETGVMVEAATTWEDMTATCEVTETNMWEATTVRMPWWPWIIVAMAAAGLVILFVRRRRAA